MKELWRAFREVVALRAMRRRFPSAQLHDGVVVSDDSTIGRYAVLFRRAQVLGSSIGRYSYVQTSTIVSNAELGPFCSIAADVTIGMAAHPTWFVSTSPVFYDPEQPLPRFLVAKRCFTENHPRTFIGADVWIGQRAMVKAGVSVGVGAIIGAGAIVTHDVAPYDITAGSPSRRIRSRFPKELVARLTASRWWELDDDTLRTVSDEFLDPERLLAVLDARNPIQ